MDSILLAKFLNVEILILEYGNVCKKATYNITFKEIRRYASNNYRIYSM